MITHSLKSPLKRPWQRLSHPDNTDRLLSKYVSNPTKTYTLQDILSRNPSTDSGQNQGWQDRFADALDSFLVELNYVPCSFIVVECHPSAFTEDIKPQQPVTYNIVLCDVETTRSSRFWNFVTITGLSESEKDIIVSVLDWPFQLSQNK